MERKDERSGVERRNFNTLNASLPYLTKQGPVLYNRRSGYDRRQLAEQAAAELLKSPKTT